MDIQGMEDVRSHLRNMLRLSENAFAGLCVNMI